MELKTNSHKNLSIETLRGITIILMVAGHVVGGDHTGLKTESDSLLRYIFYIFSFIRMPMFTAIAGYIYASHSISTFEQVAPFIKRKSTRLLIPFITVATIFYLFKKIVPDINTPAPGFESMWNIYLFSYEHFWFVQAIFLVFAIIAIMEANKLLVSMKKWFVITIITFLFSIFITLSFTFFSINRVPYLLSFFLLGLGLKRFECFFTRQSIKNLLLLVFILSFTIQQVIYFAKVTFVGLELKVLSNIVGFSGIATIIFLRPLHNKLAWVGYYSFGIYLLHVFATAGSRILLNLFDLHNQAIGFSFGLLAGVSLPILFQIWAERFPIFNLLFFGRPIKKQSPRSVNINTARPAVGS